MEHYSYDTARTTKSTTVYSHTALNRIYAQRHASRFCFYLHTKRMTFIDSAALIVCLV